MAIIIPNNRIEIPEMVKLFSNPVSGIACMMDPKSNFNLAHGGYYHLRNIRYSKSMILGALRFWGDQLFNFYLKITKITNPLAPMHDSGQDIQMGLNTLDETIDMVKKLPDTFLFSHRYIQSVHIKQLNQGLELQKKLLWDKYPDSIYGEIEFQKGKIDPFFDMRTYPDFQFTVFPNEHPYIKRAVIAEVGQTSKGNTFIIKK